MITFFLPRSPEPYVGFEWDVWWFVNATLPFGWKSSSFVYQSIGLASVRLSDLYQKQYRLVGFTLAFIQ